MDPMRSALFSPPLNLICQGHDLTLLQFFGHLGRPLEESHGGGANEKDPRQRCFKPQEIAGVS